MRPLGRTKSPCYECENRKPGCHDHCEEFLTFQKKHIEEVQAIKAKKKQESCVFNGPNTRFVSAVWKNHKY